MIKDTSRPVLTTWMDSDGYYRTGALTRNTAFIPHRNQGNYPPSKVYCMRRRYWINRPFHVVSVRPL